MGDRSPAPEERAEQVHAHLVELLRDPGQGYERILFTISGTHGGHVYAVARVADRDFPLGILYWCGDLEDHQVEFTAWAIRVWLEEPHAMRLKDFRVRRQGIGWISSLDDAPDVPLDRRLWEDTTAGRTPGERCADG